MKEFVADFETCTYKGRERVWLWAIREASKDIDAPVEIGTDISTFLDLVNERKTGCNIYFHNLKFDSDFIVYFMLENGYTWQNKKNKDLKPYEFTCNVSFLSVVYSVTLKNKNGKIITFRDSLKLFTASEAKLASDYKLPTVKGEIDYKKSRSPKYKPTKKEIEYIKNDVYIIAHILTEFREQGYKKYTTASSALYEFVTTCFPMRDGTINYGISYNMFKERHIVTEEQDEKLRNAYRGGYCYVNPKFKGKDIAEGCVFDVNSMYPSVMYNCYMPYGSPIRTEGKPFYNKYYNLFITHIKADFTLKDGKFPCIQNKGRKLPHVNSRDYIVSTDGHIIDFWLTSVDLKLFFKCYDVYHFEYIESYSFKSKEGGYFRPYIDRFIQIKNEGKAEGNASKKQFGKLFLNSLYGKMGAKTLNFVMRPEIEAKHKHLVYRMEEESRSEPIYIPLACFITSYAREKLFNCILNNADRFLYSDTDSVHLIGTEDAKGIEIDSQKLGAWDKELIFKRARYLGCKTYVEDTDNGLVVHCAGLSASALNNVTFDNFQYNAEFEIKKCRATVGGKIIDNTTFKIKER